MVAIDCANLAKWVRDVPDWPVPGVMFRDITPLLKDRSSFSFLCDRMVQPFLGKEIDYVAGIESRGFILASPIAERLNAGVIPIRKAGKLPWNTTSVTYDLEYGKAEIEVHEDSIQRGDKVLIVDDVLATGGTAKAAAELFEILGGQVVGMSFFIELGYLGGRKKIDKYFIDAVLSYL